MMLVPKVTRSSHTTLGHEIATTLCPRKLLQQLWKDFEPLGSSEKEDCFKELHATFVIIAKPSPFFVGIAFGERI